MVCALQIIGSFESFKSGEMAMEGREILGITREHSMNELREK